MALIISERKEEGEELRIQWGLSLWLEISMDPVVGQRVS